MNEASDLSPTDLFDLSHFAHTALFEGCTYAWEALDRLESYRYPTQIMGQVSKDAHLEGEGISIGEGSVVEPGAYIRGPCLIGKGCQIRHGAYIRGMVVTGDRCVIGHDTEVKGSIFFDGAQAAHFAYVGDSILGNDINLGAGTKLANLKVRGTTIAVGNQDTGRRKLGAILGDGCQLGCNCVTNPGTVMGKGACSTPCTSLGGIIAPDALVGGRYVTS